MLPAKGLMAIAFIKRLRFMFNLTIPVLRTGESR
jgi:hypothetical protein